ncbi:MAG: hypothetical protein WC378_06950 [Opitutaceae bacterium]
MNHAEHDQLIKDLEIKVKEGPPLTGFSEPYFKRCWALIKRIGPAFKETHYPNRASKDSAWNRFQNAVEDLKSQQKQWEAMSEKTQVELLKLIENARPLGPTMADLMPPKTEAEAEPGLDSIQEGFKAPPALGKRAQLDACSAACDSALAAFMEAKSRLSHAHFKIVSAKLSEVRKQISKTWNSFNRENLTKAGERKIGREDKNSPWRQKQEGYQRKLADALSNDEACLSSKKGALASFQKTLLSTTDENELKRIRTWIADCEEIIAALETNIQSLKSRLSNTEKQLSPESPV